MLTASSLGVIQSRAQRLSDSMIVAGVAALAKMSPALKDPRKPLLPDCAFANAIALIR